MAHFDTTLGRDGPSPESSRTFAGPRDGDGAIVSLCDAARSLGDAIGRLGETIGRLRDAIG